MTGGGGGGGGGGLGVSGRALEEEEEGEEKEKGRAVGGRQAGRQAGRRSLHSVPDVTGPGCLLSFKEGRRTSNLPRFSAFNPSRPKEECQFAESPPPRGGSSWW